MRPEYIRENLHEIVQQIVRGDLKPVQFIGESILMTASDMVADMEEEIIRLRAKLAEEEIELEKATTERDHWEDKATELANDIGEALGFGVGEHSNLNCPVQTAIDGVAEMRSQINEWSKLAEAEGQEAVTFTCHGNSAPAYSCNKPGDMSGTYYRIPAPAKVPEGYALVPIEPTDEILDAMVYAKRDMEQMQVWDAKAVMTEVYQAMLKSQGGE